MEISWLQAIILGIFACLASMPGMGGTVIGNYTLGRPLVGGLVCGIVLGDIQSGILIITKLFIGSYILNQETWIASIRKKNGFILISDITNL